MDSRVSNAPKQSRSRRTTEALLQVGRRKLAEAGIEGLSMSEVAVEAGSSVGALYFRFGDKSQFLGAILAQALDETGTTFGSMLDEAVAGHWPPPELLRRWVAVNVDVIGANRHLLRAMQQHALTQPQAWQPIRDFGRGMSERLLRVLETAAAPVAPPGWHRRVRIGLQMMHGTLMNMLVSSPGPLTFDDPVATKAALAAVMVSYVWSDEAR